MSPSLPTDILDLIADHLHDEITTLRACCLVSKWWVPRTRRHLFAFLEFDASPRSESTLELWMKAFPDPSNSPARYTRGLHLARCLAVTVAISKARRWVHSFNHLTYLEVTTAGVDDHHISFTQLHGLSTSLKSLRLSYSHAPLPELLALICSFPLLEDLVLGSVRDRENTPERDAPPTSPKFTGSLCLGGKARDISRKLLDLPGGLHFSSIAVSCPIEDGDLANELVSMCSDTLESFLLDFSYLGVPGILPSLNLSKAIKLRNVEFRPSDPNVKWISVALRTAKSKNLWQITIHLDTRLMFTMLRGPVGEMTRQEWQDLDHLLV